MLACSNAFDLEGLIAVTGKFLRPGHNNEYKSRVHPELFHELTDYRRIVLRVSEHESWADSPQGQGADGSELFPIPRK